MWALKRQLGIGSVLFLVFSLCIFFLYSYFNEKLPTCFDQIQNGQEEGVDCGGLCEQVCKVQATQVNVLWAKTFEVTDNVSNVAALVENPNAGLNITARYVIKVFDNEGVRLKNMSNKISLGPAEKRLLFLPSFVTGERKVAQTFIDFEEIESLTQGDRETIKGLVISAKELNSEEGYTRLGIEVENTGLVFKRDIEVSAVLKDVEGQIVDIGQSFIDYIPKRNSSRVEITWPKVITEKDLLIDVYLREMR